MRVAAASSLTEVMKDLAQSFEAKNPGVRVELELSGSQTHRLRIEHGARVDVFASAHLEHVQALVERDLTVGVIPFAQNELVIVTPSDARSDVQSFGDLARVSTLVIGSPEVPAGAYADAVLERAASVYGPALAATIRSKIVSREPNVRMVRAKVELGEADAALAYRTDARGTRLRVVELPASLRTPVTYALTLGRDSTHARAFAEHVRSSTTTLAAHGFGVDS